MHKNELSLKHVSEKSNFGKHESYAVSAKAFPHLLITLDCADCTLGSSVTTYIHVNFARIQ